METVSLIFINWNSADLLFAAADTFRLTRHPYRVIVVDNGSADDSCARIRERLPDARLIEMGYNSGFATAVNAGLQAADTRYALILNTDIEFQNDVPALLLRALNDFDAALACPQLRRPDGSLQAAVVPEPTLLTELTNRSVARRLLDYSESEPLRLTASSALVWRLISKNFNHWVWAAAANISTNVFSSFSKKPISAAVSLKPAAASYTSRRRI